MAHFSRIYGIDFILFLKSLTGFLEFAPFLPLKLNKTQFFWFIILRRVIYSFEIKSGKKNLNIS